MAEWIDELAITVSAEHITKRHPASGMGDDCFVESSVVIPYLRMNRNSDRGEQHALLANSLS